MPRPAAGDGLAMNESEAQMNLKALKKLDPYIASIVAHSGQVALYKFQQGRGDWDKTEIEGTLFVYEREADPKYGFTIMNRLNMENLVEVVTKELDFQLQTPFLLYRNNSGEIYGIWFYEQAECEVVSKKIEKLIKDTEKRTAKKQGGAAGGGGGGGKLGELFKTAEKQSDGKKSGPTGKDPEAAPGSKSDASGANLLRLLSQQDTGQRPVVTPSPPVAESTSAVVLDFFARASSTQSSSPHLLSSAFTSVPPGPPPPSVLPSQHPAQHPGPRPPFHQGQGHPQGQGHHGHPQGLQPTVTAMPISQGLSLGYVPVASSLPPPGPPPSVLPAGPGLPPAVAAVPRSLPPAVVGLPGVHSVESLEAEQRRKSPPSGLSEIELQLRQVQLGSSHHFAPVAPGQQGPGAGQGVTLLSPQVFSSQPSARAASPPSLGQGGARPGSGRLLAGQAMQAQANYHGHHQLPGPVKGLLPGQAQGLLAGQPQGYGQHLPPSQGQGNVQLQGQGGPGMGSGQPRQNGHSSRHNGHNGRPSPPPASALTPGQMVEAMSYLLETDPHFVQKLHEAYILALNRKLQNSHV